MSSYKLTLRHISDEAAIVPLLLVNRLLLLRHVLVVGHRAQDHTSSVESPSGNWGVESSPSYCGRG